VKHQTATLEGPLLGALAMTGIIIKPMARRSYKGAYARRQAFYDGKRTARLLQRLWRAVPPLDISDTYADALIYAMPDGTLRRQAPIEVYR
jgi:hypothetical protein